MTRPAWFDFHGIASAMVDTEDRAAADFFDREYGALRVGKAAPAPSARLEWSRTRFPFDRPADQRRHAHKVLARWSYRIRFSEDGIRISARGNRLAIPMVHHMMVHPSLRYLSSARGTILLHAAAVERGGRSLLLTGPGGVGKTTTAAALLSDRSMDWSPHADDYVFLEGDGTTHAYPSRSHLYLNLIRALPELRPRLTRREALALEVYWGVRVLSGDRIKWPVRAAAERLWPGAAMKMSARAAAVVVLRRSGSEEPELLPRAGSQWPVTELLRMNFAEGRHFIGLVERGEQKPAPGWRESWEAREREILQAAAAKVPCFELRIPSSPGRRAIEAVRETIDRLHQELTR